MEAAHATYPIRQQTAPEGTGPLAEPLIRRRFPDGHPLSGRRFLGLDPVVFLDPSVLMPSIEHPNDAE
jgi:hypothetical protein